MRFIYDGTELTPVVALAFSAAYRVECEWWEKFLLHVDVLQLQGCRYVRVRMREGWRNREPGPDGDDAILRRGALALTGRVILIWRALSLSYHKPCRISFHMAPQPNAELSD